MRQVLIALALTLVTSCGTDPKPAPTEYVESQTCRDIARPFVAAMEAMLLDGEDGLTLDEIRPRYAALEDGVVDTKVVCSAAFNAPYARVMYQLALASAALQACETGVKCDEAAAQKHLSAAAEPYGAMKAALAAER